MKRHYCEGCLKYNPGLGTCVAFKELWPEWGSGECWAREENPVRWKETKDAVDLYSGNPVDPTPIDVKGSPITTEEIHAVFLEDQKRGKGGGGGESNKDGSGFGPQQMRNNKFQHRRLNPKKWSGWYD